jgi:hypothetical protein
VGIVLFGTAAFLGGWTFTTISQASESIVRHDERIDKLTAAEQSVSRRLDAIDAKLSDIRETLAKVVK